MLPAVSTGEPQADETKATTGSKRKSNKPQGGNLSAIDAAAKVLAENAKSMSAKEMIEKMAVQGYWKTPGGKMPDATLYASILREIKVKGSASRFVKAERGKFALRTAS